MEYNAFQHQDQTNSEALHAQECTHMNDIAYHVCPDFFFFFKLTYQPAQFLGKQTFFRTYIYDKVRGKYDMRCIK